MKINLLIFNRCSVDCNEATFYKQQRLVHWCNAYDQGNYRNIHSDEYRSKTEKKYKYY